jgi:SAM-dependent methyltransferase
LILHPADFDMREPAWHERTENTCHRLLFFSIIGLGAPRQNSIPGRYMEQREPDYYSIHHDEYHARTFGLDPGPFLMPLAERLPPGARILDVGCSSGRDLKWFIARGFDVTGFERSAGLARKARRNAGCEVIEGDFETADFSSFAVDALTLIAALVHVPGEKLPQVLKRILPAVKPGGYILITMKEGTSPVQGSGGRIYYRWRDDDLRRLFAELGLRILYSRRRGSFLSEDVVWLEYVLTTT